MPGSRSNPWQAQCAITQLLVEFASAKSGFVRQCAEVALHYRQIFGSETWVYCRKPRKASQQESGADQQQNGESDFDDQQPRSQLVGTAGRSTRGCSGQRL